MAKLDPDKAAWIIRERRKAVEGREGAFTVGPIAQ